MQQMFGGRRGLLHIASTGVIVPLEILLQLGQAGNLPVSGPDLSRLQHPRSSKVSIQVLTSPLCF